MTSRWGSLLSTLPALLVACAEADTSTPVRDAAADSPKTDAPTETLADSSGADGAGDVGDASDASDAGTDAGGIVLCGGLRCRLDQACVKDLCAFPCTGVAVPGDYSTVSSAVSALASTGGTICLGESTFKETVSISGSDKWTLIGVANDRSIVSRVQVTGAAATVVLKGIGVTDGVQTDSTNLSLVGVKLTPSLLNRHGLTVRSINATSFTVKVDGCDIQPTKGYSGVYLTDTTYGAWNLNVSNSWIHDGKVGVDVFHNLGPGTTPTVKVLNDTFTGNDTAIQATRTGSGTGAVSLTYVNDLVVKNGVGINFNGGTTFTHRNNAFFGNTTNYGGAATPGAGYVTTDPLMNELSTPPSLKPGSPCRGAADPILAPTVDFWGVTRSKKFDIGAVQSL
jgi:hypothetical protein